MTYSKVTMIDDSRADALLLKRAIGKNYSNIDFSWIGDSEEGLNYLSDWSGDQPELILLDIKMPKLTGLELLEKLTEQRQLNELPRIVVMSSSSLERDRKAACSYPGVDYRSKPGGYHEIVELIGELLNPEDQAAH